MNIKPVMPEDVLPDGQDFVTVNGVIARKATIATLFVNIEVVESRDTSLAQKQLAMKNIESLLPTLKALPFRKHISFNNKEVQALFREI